MKKHGQNMLNPIDKWYCTAMATNMGSMVPFNRHFVLSKS